MTGTNILAAGDSDPTVKIVIGVVVAAFWIISQVVGALAKKPDQQRVPSRVPPTQAPPTAGVPPGMPPRQPPLGRTNVPRPQPASVPPRVKRQKPPPIRRQPQTPPRPASAPLPAAEPLARRAPLADATPPKPVAAGIPRRQMLNALLKARNLRKAYILSEVLRPPVALRSPGDGGPDGRP